jgi:hypothetical protein
MVIPIETQKTPPAITSIYRDLDTETRQSDSVSQCAIPGSASERDEGCDSESDALLAWGFDVQLSLLRKHSSDQSTSYPGQDGYVAVHLIDRHVGALVYCPSYLLRTSDSLLVSPPSPQGP